MSSLKSSPSSSNGSTTETEIDDIPGMKSKTANTIQASYERMKYGPLPNKHSTRILRLHRRTASTLLVGSLHVLDFDSTD